MNNSREALRRNRLYSALVVACVIYGAWPLTPHEAALLRAEQATEVALDWLARHAAQVTHPNEGEAP